MSAAFLGLKKQTRRPYARRDLRADFVQSQRPVIKLAPLSLSPFLYVYIICMHIYAVCQPQRAGFNRTLTLITIGRDRRRLVVVI